MIQHLVLDITS